MVKKQITGSDPTPVNPNHTRNTVDIQTIACIKKQQTPAQLLKHKSAKNWQTLAQTTA